VLGDRDHVRDPDISEELSKITVVPRWPRVAHGSGEDINKLIPDEVGGFDQRPVCIQEWTRHRRGESWQRAQLSGQHRGDPQQTLVGIGFVEKRMVGIGVEFTQPLM